jgi:hypothetical protein
VLDAAGAFERLLSPPDGRGERGALPAHDRYRLPQLHIRERSATWLTGARWWARTSLWPRLRPWLVRAWVLAAIAALLVVAVLLLGQWVRYGFRDRPFPPG